MTRWDDAAVVLVVDDHPLVCEALVQVLQASTEAGAPPLRCRAAGSVAQARQCLMYEPGLAAVLADLRLPDGDGLALLTKVRGWAPQAVRILLSGQDEPGLAQRVRNLGLEGYLSKSLDPRQLVAGVRSALAGGACFPDGAAVPATPTLSARQSEVLALVGRGYSNKEVARLLGVTERTVKDHLSIAFARLSAHSRAAAVARAGALGLIPLG